MVRTETLLMWDAAAPAKPAAPLEDGDLSRVLLNPAGDRIFLNLPLCLIPCVLI